MVPFTQTSTFVAVEQRLEADIAKFATDLETMKACIRAFPRKKRGEAVNSEKVQAQKFRDNLKSKLDTRKGKLKRLHDLRLPLWYLVEFLSAALDELWTAEQAESWTKELAAHEGRGEKALRLRYGVTEAPSHDDCDIILGAQRIEVKNLQGRSEKGKFVIQDIQTGHHGRKTYCRWMFKQAKAGAFDKLNEEMQDAIATGEVPQSLLYNLLPEEIRADIHEVLKPSNVLGSYDVIVGTTRFGSITIPKADLDRAWSLKTVTKAGPKYTLRKAYVVERLMATLPPKDLSDVAAE